MFNWMPIWPQHGTAKPSDNTSQMYRHTCMAQNWLDFPFSSSAAIYPTAPCGWKTLIVRLFSISFSKSSLVLDVDKACFHFIVLSLGCLRMLESMEPHLTWSTKFTTWLIPTRHSWKAVLRKGNALECIGYQVKNIFWSDHLLLLGFQFSWAHCHCFEQSIAPRQPSFGLELDWSTFPVREHESAPLFFVGGGTEFGIFYFLLQTWSQDSDFASVARKWTDIALCLPS